MLWAGILKGWCRGMGTPNLWEPVRDSQGLERLELDRELKMRSTFSRNLGGRSWLWIPKSRSFHLCATPVSPEADVSSLVVTHSPISELLAYYDN
jgi:hypothetical protein